MFHFRQISNCLQKYADHPFSPTKVKNKFFSFSLDRSESEPSDKADEIDRQTDSLEIAGKGNSSETHTTTLFSPWQLKLQDRQTGESLNSSIPLIYPICVVSSSRSLVRYFLVTPGLVPVSSSSSSFRSDSISVSRSIGITDLIR